MKIIARTIIFFLLFSTHASARDFDHCEQDLQVHSVEIMADHQNTFSVQVKDSCCHCGHMTAHFVGLAVGKSADFLSTMRSEFGDIETAKQNLNFCPPSPPPRS